MPGESALFINGRQADLDVYDVFSLVETLRSEAKLMQGLHDLGQQYKVDGDIMNQLLKLDLKESETMYAVDIRDPAVLVSNYEMSSVWTMS
jgi:UDP-glucose:glycoprotein glucosyltransferase